MAEDPKPSSTPNPEPWKNEFAFVPPKPSGAKPAPPRILRAHPKGKVISILPDVKYVGKKPTAFQTYGRTSDQKNYSANVFVGGKNAMKHDSAVSKTYGGEAGTGGGVKSGTYMFESHPQTHSDIVRINGEYAERHDDLFKHNGPKDKPNTIGKAQHPVSTEPVKPPDGRTWYEKVGDGLKPTWEGIKNQASTIGEGLYNMGIAASPYLVEDPGLAQQIKASPEYAEAAGKAGDFWSSMATGIKDAAVNTGSFLGDALVAGQEGVPDDVRAEAQARVNEAVDRTIVAPVKEQYDAGGAWQAGGFIAGKIAQIGAEAALTKGAGRVAGALGEAAEAGTAARRAEAAGAKSAEKAAEKAAGREGAETTSGKPGGRDVPEEPKNQKGRADCPCEVSNPVRIDTGASLSHDVEFAIRGTLDLVLSRHYASDETFLGPLGRGVSSPIDVVLTETADGDLVYRESVHRRIGFERPAPFPLFWVHNDAYRHLALAFDDLDTLVLKDRGRFHRFARCPDGAWRLMRIEDRNGNAIVVTRDPQGLITRIDHPDGLALAFANDPQGRRIRVALIGADGGACEILRYAYDARGNLAAAEATHGPSRYYEYDDRDRRVAWTDGVTTWSRRVYDAEGRAIRNITRDADGAPAPFDGDTFQYEPENNRTLYTPGRHPEERRWYRYDADGLVTAIEDARGAVTRQVWNAAGEKVAEIDAEGRRTTYRYDEHGFLAAITDPSGRETRAYHDPDGNLEHVFDALGQAWTYAYDDARNLVAVTDPLGHRTDITNDPHGRPVARMRHDGLIERRSYDAQGRLASLRDERDGLTRIERDGFGRITAVTDPTGAVTRYRYEPGGLDFWRPSAVVAADGAETRLSADPAGARVTAVDGEGRRTVRRFGAYGLLAEIEDPQGGRVRLRYDGLGRLERVENQRGRHWTFARDATGAVVAETDFDGLCTTYTHDRAGRLTAKQAADGTRTAYDWDASGRLLAETVTGPDGAGQVARFAYDRAGQLVEAHNAGARVALERDRLGRVVAETVNGRRIDSTYDCCGHRTARTGLGAAVASAYDPLGALAELRIGEHAPLRLFHDAAGRETQRESGRGFVLASGHDPAGRLRWNGPTAGTGRPSRSRSPIGAGGRPATATTATGRWRRRATATGWRSGSTTTRL
ncbi:PAAR-like domain-containing protein [Methylobacterium indicum]|uniref:PAAR-like domain-containing protein n=1 Tax=Methylobacterium indicum TaxID=1775910 RepID=UPI0024354F05|nr:PAAR-like domain-containing protein [Methylobacterium indicum]